MMHWLVSVPLLQTMNENADAYLRHTERPAPLGLDRELIMNNDNNQTT